VDTTTTWALDELVLEEEELEAADEVPDVARADELPLPENPLPPVEPDDPLPELVDAEVPAAPEDEDDPVTCCPTVRLIDATVPAMVEVNVAWLRAVCALVTLFCATRMPAWSEAIWADDAPSSSSVVSWA
jgi:hypothetical protein